MRVWLAAMILLPASLAAQGPSALSRGDEIRIARSAAPAEITKDARVYVLDHDHYVVAEPGNSTISCMVFRTEATSLEPNCGDAEADATVLAVDRFRTEQRIAGHSRAEIQRAIADGLAAGRFRAPKRPALVYMMSSKMNLVDPSGKSIGKWNPHVMVFYPNLHESDLGLVDSQANMMNVVEPGTALSGLVVVTQSFVDPAPTQ